MVWCYPEPAHSALLPCSSAEDLQVLTSHLLKMTHGGRLCKYCPLSYTGQFLSQVPGGIFTSDSKSCRKCWLHIPRVSEGWGAHTDKERFAWALFSSVFMDDSFVPQQGGFVVTVSKD